LLLEVPRSLLPLMKSKGHAKRSFDLFSSEKPVFHGIYLKNVSFISNSGIPLDRRTHFTEMGGLHFCAEDHKKRVKIEISANDLILLGLWNDRLSIRFS
jgi:hypothetical protein